MTTETQEILDKSKQIIITDPNTNELVIMPNRCLLLWDKEGKYLFMDYSTKSAKNMYPNLTYI